MKQVVIIGLIVGCGFYYVLISNAQITSESLHHSQCISSTDSDDTSRNLKPTYIRWPQFDEESNQSAGLFSNIGADACADVAAVSIPVGPEGSPTSITIIGDNTPATGPDCNGLGLSPIWWEAFSIDQPAYVYIDLCNTNPMQEPSYQILLLACTDRQSCGSSLFISPQESGRGSPVCSDNNVWMKYRLTETGIYYLPIFSDESQLVNGRGPYELHIAAEELTDYIPGPDIITGHIANADGLLQLGRIGEVGSGTIGLGLSTTSCNRGDKIARWFELPNTNHPVMTGNLYRYQTVDGSQRLEQIGQAWIKHGFGSSNDDECGFGCNCSPAQGCTVATVGAGCSDTYAGVQFNPCGFGGTGLMASRSVIHPYTGSMPGGANLGSGGGCNNNFPSANHFGHNHSSAGIAHRLQVQDVDLISELNPVARYIAEGQYVVPDEYIENNGTQNNNVSHREFDVIGPDSGGGYIFQPIESTHDQSPAIDVWTGASQSVIEPTPLRDGRAYLVYEVTELGSGLWHYEYGLYNMNLHEALHSIAFPVPTGVTISNAEFHAPLNHAPEANAENYPNTPWSFRIRDDNIFWSVSSYEDNPLDNAVRWGTMYNFRFDADTPPQTQFSSVGLYRSGYDINVPTLVPQAVGPVDCNNNGIFDQCDLDCNLSGCNVEGCGMSVDCDGTGVPDECEIDCNENGIADSCDIAGDSSLDASGNGILDACDLTAPATEPSAISKNRYISIMPGNPGRFMAIRVRLTHLEGFESYDNQIRWVGPPGEYPEGTEFIHLFNASRLRCTPYYQDWSEIDVLHIYGDEIVPGSIYDVQLIAETLDITNENSFSKSYIATTLKWGDIVAPYHSEVNVQPAISDVLSLVDKWLGNLNPMKSRAQLQPDVPNPILPVGIADILQDVDAWLGVPYPFDGPGECP